MNNKLITITGPSGSGKSTLANLFPLSQTIVSFTTRVPRPGEIDGQDYYFWTKEQVEKMKDADNLVELVEYNGNLYGYTKDELFSKMLTGNCVAVVTKEGYDHLHSIPEMKDHIIPVFLKINKNNIITHMQNRNDSEANIKKRISLFNSEAANEKIFRTLPHNLIINMNDKTKQENIDDFVAHLAERGVNV